MANFVKGSELNHEIDSLFENALDQLTIVSPFIKLHSRQKDALRSKMNDPKFKLTLVYGKNESNKSRKQVIYHQKKANRKNHDKTPFNPFRCKIEL